MNAKKLLSAMFAGATVISIASVSVFAGNVAMGTAYNSDGEASEDIVGFTSSISGLALNSQANIGADPVYPGSTVYIPLATEMNEKFGSSAVFVEDVVNEDYFKFDVDKDVNAKLVKSVTIVDDKKLSDNLSRSAYLKIEFADTTSTDESKTTGDITFKAKADFDSYAKKNDQPVTTGSNVWQKDDRFTIHYNFWVSNREVGNDDNPDTGDGIVMNPDDNDTNVLVWGDDRAALEFESDDDASKFYAKMSTKSIADIYTEYGDPVDADLWFYDFVGSSTIPSTSRAWLTLGIPWDDNDDYTPDPTSCYIYELDADGNLTDVTSSFSYSEDEREIPGWSRQTRTLGTYIVSDTELDIAPVDDTTTDEPAPEPETPSTTPEKPIPNTGR
ncbi:hypothetical protein [Anaerotruncus colihominis]